MARFTNLRFTIYDLRLWIVLCLLVSPVRADDATALLNAPNLPPYEWFASTDPQNKNADYIPLKPGETRRVPLAAGNLERLWSTAFEPDKITLVLQNGNQRVELLRNNKAKFGELYQKAFTFYPTGSTPVAARELKNGAALIATNHSKNENKWFYQATVRPRAAVKPVAPAAKDSSVQPPRIEPNDLEEIIREPAHRGLKALQLPQGAKSPYHLVSASGSARSQKGKPIPILKVQGAGAFVGLVLDIRPTPDTTRRTFAFLEGNEFLIADGKTYEGTGTEDYFNSAWYYPGDPFTRPYHGMTFKGLEPPRVTTYRWMIPDAVPFKNSFEFQLEHGNGNNSNDLEYRWVAFWYQKAPFEFEIADELKNSSGGQGSTPGAAAAGQSSGAVAIMVLAALGAVAALGWVLFAWRSRGRSG